jgi:hypothetical protein
MFSFPFYALIWQSFTSCGPEECADLTIDVNDILEDQEYRWLERRDERWACEDVCDDIEEECLDFANGNYIPDPLDTAPPILPTIAECEDEAKDCYEACPQERDLAKTFEYGSGDYPLISWSGGDIALLSVRIDYAKGLDDFYWSIKCADESNCLQSPVSFKPLNENDTLNANELEEEEPFVSLNDRVVYTISAGRANSDNGCAVKKELELPFEYLQGKRYQFD